MFTIRLPFQLAEHTDIQVTGPLKETTVAGYPGSVRADNGWYVLSLRDVPTQAQAEQLLVRLGTGLRWVSVDKGTGVRWSRDLQSMHVPDDPVAAGENLAFGRFPANPVHAIGDGGRPAIYETGQNVSVIYAGRAKASIGYPPQDFLCSLATGAEFTRAIADHPKLVLALDLYSGSHFESSAPSGFLTMCSALEVAAPSSTLGTEAIAVVEQWRKQAEELAAQMPGTDARCEVVALARRVGNLKTSSHTERIARYVARMLRAAGHERADALTREVVKLYGLRGSLVHDGQTELGDGVARLDEILREALRSNMRMAAPKAQP